MRKWPLEGFWEGIRGRLRSGESRGDKGEEGDISEGGNRAEGETERISESSGDDRLREDKNREEEDDVHSHHSNLSGSVRRMEESSDEREISSSADGGGTGRVRSSQQARRSGEKKARPAPNPKPAVLKVARELHAGSSSDSDGVKFSLTRDGSPKVVSLEEKLERPKPTKLRTAKPQPRLKRPDQYQTTQTKKTSQQPTQTKPEENLVGHEPQVTPATTNDTKRRFPTHNIPTASRADIHSPSAPTDKSPLAARSHSSLGAGDTSIDTLSVRLQRQASENDYYQLFGVDCTATTEDLARVRRDKSRQFHPDHFANQPEKQERYKCTCMHVYTFMYILYMTLYRYMYNTTMSCIWNTLSQTTCITINSYQTYLDLFPV